MLTTNPRRTSPHRTLGLRSVLTVLCASLAGCPDALHLDAGGTASTGGDGGPLCISNTDCAVPTPVCDTEKQQCFECLVVSDCAAKGGTVCSMGTCIYPGASSSSSSGMGSSSSSGMGGMSADAGDNG
jgi:hypothetical protein